MKNKIMLSIIIIAMILLIVAAAFLQRQSDRLDQYENGFPIEGTYSTGDSGEGIYLVFSESNTAYYYQQFGELNEAHYRESNNPNLYFLEKEDGTKGYVFLAEDRLTYVEGDEVILYKKNADGGLYINVDEPAISDTDD